MSYSRKRSYEGMGSGKNVRRVTLPSGKAIQLVNAALHGRAAKGARMPPGYQFSAPATQQEARMDIEQGERAAVMLGMGLPSSAPSARYLSRVSPYQYNSVSAFRKAKAASKASLARQRAYNLKQDSKASLARARLSAKKGGSRPSKATSIKAVRKGTYASKFRAFNSRTKKALVRMISSQPKATLASCLAKASIY